MTRKGRDSILQHVDRAKNCIDNYLLHIMQIDGLYAGAKQTDSNGNFIPVEIPEITDNEPYAPIRKYLHNLSTIAQELQDMTDAIKGY